MTLPDERFRAFKQGKKLLEELCRSLSKHTKLCVACDITLPTEYIKTKTVEQWSKNKVDLNKRPTIFIIHKS